LPLGQVARARCSCCREAAAPAMKSHS
jgi:hypothetical protein